MMCRGTSAASHVRTARARTMQFEPWCPWAMRRSTPKRPSAAPSTRVAAECPLPSSFDARCQRSALGKERRSLQRSTHFGRIISMILSLVFLSLAVLPQDTLRLSLPEAVTLALRDADEVKRAYADVAITEAQVTTSRASALPQLRLSGTYNHVL